MAEVLLAAEARRTTGSSEARRLRGDGKVPAVLYGHGIEPQPLVVDARALRGALNQESGLNTLLSLQVDSTRHLQRHPLRGSVIHVDFVIVRRDEVVSAEVPIRLVGEATGVARADGVVEQQLFTLLVHATPLDIPPHLDVDVSGLRVGDTVRVGDLPLPRGVTTDVDAEEPVVVAAASAVSAEVAAEEEAAEVEAAEAEAGEAPAPEGTGASAEGGGGEGATAEG
jgi:large subunit ribosomal protein L25